MVRVILSSPILILDKDEAQFHARRLSLGEARAWVEAATEDGSIENYCGHETVKILGLEPAQDRRNCDYYDVALCASAKERLEFGREYTIEEIEEIGVDFLLIQRI